MAATTPTVESLQHEITGLKGQITKLKKANAKLQEQLAQQTRLAGNYVGDVPENMPRDRYAAPDPIQRRTFLTGAEQKAAEQEQPNHWFATKEAAREAYAASQANT